MSTEKLFLGCARRLDAGVARALLGEEPVYARDRAFATVHVRLDLEVDLSRRRVRGECRTTIRSLRPKLRKAEFDAVGLKISAVSAGGRPAAWKRRGGKLVVVLPRGVAEGAEADVCVRYSVERPEAGLHFVSPGRHGGPQLWSQSQPDDARRWFPCQDAPGEKATSEVRASVPAGFTAVSNGVLLERKRRGGREIFHWRMDRPHSLYLITLAAGRFAEVKDDWDGIPLSYYCERGREADARRGFAKTAKAMELFSRLTGVRYPYPRYAQVAVAEYPGGMEHTTATTQTDACLLDAQAALDHDLDTLVAHELAHQWFGDLVTCREWSHAWLNEGFATYMEAVFLEHDRGRDEADWEMLQNARAYFDEDARRYRRPVVCRTYKDSWTLFDRHLYEKGGWILRMLRARLGDEAWWKAVRHWLTKHRDSSVETADFARAVAEATGRDIQAFLDQWIHRPGAPALRLRWSWDARRRRGELWLRQTQEVSPKAPAFRFPLRVRISGPGWSKEFREDVSREEHRWVWRLPSEPAQLLLDPDFELLARVELHKPWAMWRRQLSSSPLAVHRALAAAPVARWGGEAAARTLEGQIRREPFWGAAVEMVEALSGVSGHAAAAALRRLFDAPGVSHPKVRRAIVEALGRRGDAGDARRLAPLARGAKSLLVRAEATRALGALDYRGHRAIVAANLKARTYRDGVAAAAVSALAASRDPGAALALARLSRPASPFAVRAAAARALADYSRVSRGALPALCALLGDPDERMSLVACSALGAAGDESALPALERASRRSANPRVRVYAEEALARIRAGGKTRSRLIGPAPAAASAAD